MKDACPECKANLVGEPVPGRYRSMYAASHFSRKIGLYDQLSDRVTAWKCPDCGHVWGRG